MFRFIGLCLGTLVRLLRARRSLLLENLALRQQLAVLKRRHPRPRLDLLDKLFWVAVRRFWSGWQQSLIVVTPETVVRWHRAGFRLYWKLISKVRRPVGRRQTSKEIQELIFRMVVENSTWGAPRIHGELLMLGFDVSERTVNCPGACLIHDPTDDGPTRRIASRRSSPHVVEHIDRQFFSGFAIVGYPHDQCKNDSVGLFVKRMQRKLIPCGDGLDEPDPVLLGYGKVSLIR